MLEKKGTEGEEEAKRAYIAAREVADHAAETAGDKVSSALIEKVRLFISLMHVYYLL